MENKKTTLKELAQTLGVSVGTVHRAIYGKPGVGEKTRARILAEVEKTDYQIDEVASMLKRKELNVAVVLPKAAGEDKYYFRGIWQGIEEAARSLRRYKINYSFFQSDYRLDNMAMALRELYDNEVDGIQGLITIADDRESGEWVSRFSRLGIPVVLISSYEENVACVSSIKVDHQICGRLAAEYFAVSIPEQAGKIMLLSGHSDIYSNRIYAGAFEEYMAERHPGFEIVRVEGFGKDNVLGGIGELFAAHEFRGVFTCNARNTYLMCEALHTLKKVGGSTFIGTDVFHELAPYFQDGTICASIYQYHREQGERAVHLMHEHLTSNQEQSRFDQLPAILVFGSNFHFFAS